MTESIAGGAAKVEGFMGGRVMAHPPAKRRAAYSIQIWRGGVNRNSGRAAFRHCPNREHHRTLC